MAWGLQAGQRQAAVGNAEWGQAVIGCSIQISKSAMWQVRKDRDISNVPIILDLAVKKAMQTDNNLFPPGTVSYRTEIVALNSVVRWVGAQEPIDAKA